MLQAFPSSPSPLPFPFLVLSPQSPLTPSESQATQANVMVTNIKCHVNVWNDFHMPIDLEARVIIFFEKRF
jgi:hypothetical protein